MVNEKGYEIVKFVDGELEMEVNISPQENTVWLNQKQLATLFKVNTQAITKQLSNIYSNQELDYSSTCSILEQVEYEGNRRIKRKVKYYNLDILIFLGFKMNCKQAIIFRKWANKVLKEYLLKGYVINENRVIVSNDNYIELRNEVASINNRLIKIEDKVLDKEYGLDKIFYDGSFYDAYTLIQQIFESASSEIIIIDNYLDRTVLDRLVVKKVGVNVIIYTSINSKILGTDINSFNNQYGGLIVLYTTKVHDRYIIIDQKKLYHIGHSIKDLGKKIFSISESDSNLIKELLSNI
jgi:hypothetical protein